MTRHALRVVRAARVLPAGPTWSTIATVVWSWLPEATVALRFATALIGFVVALRVLLRRDRRRTPSGRERTASTRATAAASPP
jgi:hypothetical protein